MPPEKSIASIIAETKEELKTFVQTRAQLLRAETGEKLKAWKTSILLIAVGVLLLVTCWFAFVFAIVALLHSWLSSGSYALVLWRADRCRGSPDFRLGSVRVRIPGNQSRWHGAHPDSTDS